jgi:hypothetical protein
MYPVFFAAEQRFQKLCAPGPHHQARKAQYLTALAGRTHILKRIARAEVFPPAIKTSVISQSTLGYIHPDYADHLV